MAMMTRLPLTTSDATAIVLTIDPALDAWSDEQRARYLGTGEGPAPPADATVIRIRAMGWTERRQVQRACASGLWSERGAELHRQFVEAMAAAPDRAAAVGDEYRRSLSLADRAELDRASVLQLEHDDALAETCVVDVREGVQVQRWRDFLDSLDPATARRVLYEVVHHVHRISRVQDRQRF